VCFIPTLTCSQDGQNAGEHEHGDDEDQEDLPHYVPQLSEELMREFGPGGSALGKRRVHSHGDSAHLCLCKQTCNAAYCANKHAMLPIFMVIVRTSACANKHAVLPIFMVIVRTSACANKDAVLPIALVLINILNFLVLGLHTGCSFTNNPAFVRPAKTNYGGMKAW